VTARVETGSRAPGWLLRGEVGLCPCGCVGVRRRGSFVQKTLTGGADLLRQAMYSEDLAAAPGLLQRLDARLKLLGMLVLLVATALVHHIPVLLACYAVTLVLAGVSKLPLGFFLRRVWLFVPIFTGIVVLPATLSVVTPGQVVLTLWHWHGAAQGFTAQGLTSAGLIIARVATSISLVLLVTLTTPWVKVLAALRSLGVPRIFVLIIGMAYRYVFLLLGTVTDMYQARKARTLGTQKHDRSARQFVSAGTGALLGKAHHLSEEVYLAMVSRGYRGDAHSVQSFRLRALDLAAAAVVLAAAVAIYGGDRILGR
jgi:cobalt/nickel transport system permease protein